MWELGPVFFPSIWTFQKKILQINFMFCSRIFFFNSTWCITKLLGKKSDRSTSGFPEIFQPFNSCHAVWLKVLGYYHFQRFDQTDWVTESYLAATLFLWGNLRSQIDRFNEQTCSHASIQSSWTTQPQVRTFPATAGALSAVLCWKNLQAETG